MKFAFIVQDNHILKRLTVRESLIFASKLKNRADTNHRVMASDVINKLKIQSCADNYPDLCSGGQLKRVLIGLELISKLFNLFDRIYLLSCEGQCIYNGAPESLSSLFEGIGLSCPKFTNPADFAIEVASNDHGRAKVLSLSTIQRIEAMSLPEKGYPITVDNSFNTTRHVFYLTIR